MTPPPSDDVPSHPDIKAIVKNLICDDIGVTVSQLHLLLRKRNIHLSRFTIAGIRMSFMEDLRYLQHVGVIALSSSSFPRGNVSKSTNTSEGGSSSRTARKSLTPPVKSELNSDFRTVEIRKVFEFTFNTTPSFSICSTPHLVSDARTRGNTDDTEGSGKSMWDAAWSC